MPKLPADHVLAALEKVVEEASPSPTENLADPVGPGDPDVAAALDGARLLAAAGMPIFAAPPNRTNNTGFAPPKGWQKTPTGTEGIDRWQPGWALCGVTGHGLDVIDVDPRNGGDVGAVDLVDVWPTVHARATTPSGGTHDFITTLGVRKCQPAPGVDLQAGDAVGNGRGFVFLAPTERASKTDGVVRSYVWSQPPTAEALANLATDDSGAALKERLAKPATSKAKVDGKARPARDGLPLGERDQGLWDHACWLRGKGLEWDEAEAQQREAWEKLPQPDGDRIEWEVALEKLRRAWREYQPEEPDAAIVPANALLPQEFWQARESLRAIEGRARAAMLCPDALLGGVLCRAISHIGPNVRLPAIVGSEASLNLIVALVGKSGSGKSATLGVARDMVWSAAGDALEVGSGEGIPAAYFSSVRKEIEDPNRPGKTTTKTVKQRTRYRVAFQASEIGRVGSLAGRQGSTLDSTVRQMWSGDTLGAANSSVETRNHLAAGSYRATLVIGVQPDLAGPLLDAGAEQSGTAQRVLWLSANDPTMGLPEAYPPAPQWKWDCPLPLTDGARSEVDEDGIPLDSPGTEHLMAVPGSVQREIREARVSQGRGEADPLEGHAGLTRLKVAAGLALLDGRLDLVEADWRLAGLVMEASAAVRAHCKSKLADQVTAKAAAHGRLNAVRDGAAEDERWRRVTAASEKLARHVWRNHSDGSVCPRRCQRESLGTRKGDYHEARTEAIERGWVAEQKYTPANEGAASQGEQVGLVCGPQQVSLGGR